MEKREAVEYFVKLLKERFGGRIKKVILFGSVARGDAEEDSDIDVLVIGEGITQERNLRTDVGGSNGNWGGRVRHSGKSRRV